ncbi:MAG TPA: hypothetical protein VM165_10685 [Planctomycetaceae bacterium]|nr:hypothetical protein [Planctomycetaceae bacterium]
MSRYRLFDRMPVQLRSLNQRGHDLVVARMSELTPPTEVVLGGQLAFIVSAIRTARRAGGPVIMFLGGHPIKLGLSRYLIDLMERGWITHLATNGAGIIHDFELALVGGTSEDVAKWIQAGQFGLWQETSQLNAIIREGAHRGEGLGEAVGRTIIGGRFPHADISLCAAGWRLGIPVTSHVTIGSDIIHSHPNCDGAALGATSYTDFLIFAESISRLQGGVFINVGSAVTGPEVYLKALSMARNIARQEGDEIRDFTTAVFDLIPLADDWRDGTTSKDDPFYYYRPWKTILTRTVADGGQSFYLRADHRQSIPSLWQALAIELCGGV